MRRADGPWTFYGHDGCPPCSAAALQLLRLMAGEPITLRMVSVPAPGDGRHEHGMPRLEGAAGEPVWEGGFDAPRTLREWSRVRRRRTRNRPDASQRPPPLAGRQAVPNQAQRVPR